MWDWMNAWMNEWMNARINEWLNEWMDEWMHAWMNEWMGWWMNSFIIFQIGVWDSSINRIRGTDWRMKQTLLVLKVLEWVDQLMIITWFVYPFAEPFAHGFGRCSSIILGLCSYVSLWLRRFVVASRLCVDVAMWPGFVVILCFVRMPTLINVQIQYFGLRSAMVSVCGPLLLMQEWESGIGIWNSEWGGVGVG